MAFTFKPTDADTLSVQIGVDHLLSGCIVQSEEINETVQTLEIPDQKGRIAQVIAYDKGSNVALTYIAGNDEAPVRAGETVKWYDVNGEELSCMATEVRRTCAYNDFAKWSLTGVGYSHASYHDKTDDEL